MTTDKIMGEGTREVRVFHLPLCDLCKHPSINKKAVAEYDAKLVAALGGQWAWVCEDHYQKYGVGLGTGLGQKLIKIDPDGKL